VEVGKCIDEVGIGFLFAPRLHPAMKNVALPRREMGIRTIFNILGPLTNPAGASIQLMGVYHPDLTGPLARVLALLGTERAMVVHGADSLDELSTTGTNKITQLVEGEVSSYYLNPRELGLATASLDELKGGTPEENAREMRALLGGEGGAKRDAVLLNSSAMLTIADRATDFSSGLALAAEVIDSGRALDRLDRFIEVSQSFSSIEI
jgi:anthranilate phosphoribosyltransferase